jgi:hypothetical protein
MSDQEKSEALRLLDEQLQTEKRLVEMYEETSDLILSEPARWLLHMLQMDSRKHIVSEPARWLLHMLQMDSRKHIAIFNLAIEILEGRRIEEPDRQEVSVGLEKHLELEKQSLERAREIRGNRFVKENSGLSRLMEIWSDDERHHHEYRRTAYQQLANEIKKLVSR